MFFPKYVSKMFNKDVTTSLDLRPSLTNHGTSLALKKEIRYIIIKNTQIKYQIKLYAPHYYMRFPYSIFVTYLK